MLACFVGKRRERKRTLVNALFLSILYFPIGFLFFFAINTWPFFLYYSPAFFPIQMATALPRKMAVNRPLLNINRNLIIINVS
jgi:hypothetical protein